MEKQERYYMGDKFAFGGYKILLARTEVGDRKHLQFSLVAMDSGNRWSTEIVRVPYPERDGCMWITREELEKLFAGEDLSRMKIEFSSERRNY
jgi:hypothetical protein